MTLFVNKLSREEIRLNLHNRSLFIKLRVLVRITILICRLIGLMVNKLNNSSKKLLRDMAEMILLHYWPRLKPSFKIRNMKIV